MNNRFSIGIGDFGTGAPTANKLLAFHCSRVALALLAPEHLAAFGNFYSASNKFLGHGNCNGEE
ncbi:MAG: hypothetical protein WD889_02280 [Candidatus Colwellbacteria bacterium]